MSKIQLHPKIQELKLRAAPISYSSTEVNASGQLQERESLLDQRIVEGYGCIWGNKNLHQERFFKGAFKRSIEENGPNSNAAYQIKYRDEHGRAMSLFDDLKEDNIGLYFRTKPLDDVSWADDHLTQLRSGTISNFSNGFKYIFDDKAIKWNDAEQSIDVFNARLFEISGTAIPSDLGTFAIRSLGNDDIFELTEDFIKTLPRQNQLEARRIFAIHKSLNEVEARNIHLEDLKTKQSIEKKGIDYTYLIKQF
jgi:HK97 family phage prohead protease